MHDVCNCRKFSKTAQTPAQLAAANPSPSRPAKAHRREDLLQMSMASQHAQCVRVVVDALVEGRFSRASVMMHSYEALMALVHDQQVCAALCRQASWDIDGPYATESVKQIGMISSGALKHAGKLVGMQMLHLHLTLLEG